MHVSMLRSNMLTGLTGLFNSPWMHYMQTPVQSSSQVSISKYSIILQLYRCIHATASRLTCGHVFCAICIQKAFEWQLCRRMFAFNLTKKPHTKLRLSLTGLVGRLKNRGVDPTIFFRYSCPTCQSVIVQEPLPVQNLRANYSSQTQKSPLRRAAARQYFCSLFPAC